SAGSGGRDLGMETGLVVGAVVLCFFLRQCPGGNRLKTKSFAAIVAALACLWGYQNTAPIGVASKRKTVIHAVTLTGQTPGPVLAKQEQALIETYGPQIEGAVGQVVFKARPG